MQNLLCSFVSMIMISGLVGCVELKDPHKDPEPPPRPSSSSTVLSEDLGELVVDQPLKIMNGRLVSEEDLFQLNHANKAAINWTPGKVELAFKKLSFTNKGVLLIYGNQVILKTQELESDHGRIITFPEGDKAAADVAGLDGGLLNLSAEKASGAITFEMRGQAGGDGTPGRPGRPDDQGRLLCETAFGENGKVGRNGGKSGLLSVKISDFQNLAYDVIVQPGAGGQGGAGGVNVLKATNHPEIEFLYYWGAKERCNPTDGLTQGPGQNGALQMATIFLGSQILTYPRPL